MLPIQFCDPWYNDNPRICQLLGGILDSVTVGVADLTCQIYIPKAICVLST